MPLATKLVVLGPARWKHGAALADIAGSIAWHASDAERGSAMLRVGLILWRNPDRVVVPDALYYKPNRLPLEDSPEGFLEIPPDLVVEVRDQYDSPEEMTQRIKDYFRAGVPVVWVVDCESETVSIVRAEGDTSILRGNDVLRAPDLMPVLDVPVARLFAY